MSDITKIVGKNLYEMHVKFLSTFNFFSSKLDSHYVKKKNQIYWHSEARFPLKMMILIDAIFLKLVKLKESVLLRQWSRSIKYLYFIKNNEFLILK